MMYSRTLSCLLAASLLSACASQGAKAPQHIATLDARHVEHFLALDAIANLAGGTNGPNAFRNNDGSINTFTLNAVHPDAILAAESLHLWQPTLESVAPVIWVSQKQDLLAQLQQELFDVGALTGKERQAKKQWRQLMRHIKGTRKQLSEYQAPMLLFYEEGEFFAHGKSHSNLLLAQIFEVDFIDRHLALDKKPVNASYLKLLEPDLVFVLSHGASQNTLPEDTFGADVLGTEPHVVALDTQRWQGAELTLAQVRELSEMLEAALESGL